MKPVNEPSVTVKVDIHPGPASPLQMAAWKRFWAKVITDANHDRAENHATDAVTEVNGEKPK